MHIIESLLGFFVNVFLLFFFFFFFFASDGHVMAIFYEAKAKTKTKQKKQKKNSSLETVQGEEIEEKSRREDRKTN